MSEIIIGCTLIAILARMLAYPRRIEYWAWWRRQFETAAAYCEREELLAIKRGRMAVKKGRIITAENIQEQLLGAR